MADLSTLEPLIIEKIAAMGLELFEIKFIRAGARSVLRLFVHREVGGTTLSDCERVSRELAVFLDVENFNGEQPYTLEVSSPGLDRPLTTAKEFRFAKGNNVSIRLRDVEGEKKGQLIRGHLDGVTETDITLETDAGVKTIAIEAILSGKVELQF